jgi:peptidoglycan/LPS O-acetylase OafA/YrhL
MTSRPRLDLLPEVEGVRALAVATVLLYHAHFGFSGGYVGVDVFFVVSGFLITGLLLRDRQTHGRIRFAEFYARRARRLLPAATLVLAATLALTRLVLDPIRAHQTAVDAAYAAGFMANFHFAAAGTGYLHSTLPPSALQHWWSLAVEEQFYLVWPALLGVVWWKGQHLARRARLAPHPNASKPSQVGSAHDPHADHRTRLHRRPAPTLGRRHRARRAHHRLRRFRPRGTGARGRRCRPHRCR